MRKLFVTTTLIAGGLFAIACGGSSGNPVTESNVYSGRLLVGTDIQPGTYQSVAEDFCYIARLSEFKDEYDSDIIENFIYEPGDSILLTIEPTDYAVDIDKGCAIPK